jgi:hypothetical protein
MSLSTKVVAILTTLLAGTAGAQATPAGADAEVLAVVKRVFDGMHEADSAKVRATFAPGARFVTVGTRTNPDTIVYEAVDGWLAAIARSNKAWEERTSNVRVQVDANMASAWMDYVFLLNGAVRHCGVDSMELSKVRGEWKITQLSDTRRTTGCGP